MEPISKILNKFGKVLIDNSPGILTSLGVAGLATTAYLAARGGFKASNIIYVFEAEKGGVKATPREKVEQTWRAYIPAGAVGLVSAICIVGGNSISSRRNAALISVYALTESAFREYKDKVVEQVGVKQEQFIRDEIAKDRVEHNPIGDTELLILNSGEVLCHDAYSGRYFHSNMETLRKAQNDVNFEIINGMGDVSLNEYYSKVGIARLPTGEDVGWNTDKKLELQFTTTLSEDSKPCLVVTFRDFPFPKYNRVW